MPSVSHTYSGTVYPATAGGTRVAWILTDLTDSSSYSWEVNPKTADTAYKKTLTDQASSAEDGRRITFEGRTEVQKIAFSGTVLRQGQYEAMLTWFSKRYQVQLTDDLGRDFMVYILNFNAERVRSNTYPWKHVFSGEFAILDWV